MLMFQGQLLCVCGEIFSKGARPAYELKVATFRLL
jgi:hypothetical protein